MEAVQEAINRYGTPEVFNTDQGSQFTSIEFTGLLKQNGIAISMDGKGCWWDNVFVERLWKSVKYEVYLHAYDSVSEAKRGLEKYFIRSTASIDRTRRLTTRRRMSSTSTTCPHCQKQRRQ